MKHISSKDPRKHLIMRALKIKSGGTKVTLLKEISPGVFQGHCQKRESTTDQAGFAHFTGAWTSLGDFTVTYKEAGIKGLLGIGAKVAETPRKEILMGDMVVGKVSDMEPLPKGTKIIVESDAHYGKKEEE